MYLGIDLGTSEVKALIIDENNEIVVTHSAPLTIQRPHPHWSEQSPQAWWEATEYLMTTLRENAVTTGRRSKPLAFLVKCMVPSCWMKKERRFVRRFYGTTPAVRRSARSWKRLHQSCIR